MMLFAAAVCLFVCYCAIVLMRLLPLLILKEDKNYGIIIYCTALSYDAPFFLSYEVMLSTIVTILVLLYNCMMDTNLFPPNN